jgi:short-subunit dehydrogenase
MKNLGKGDHSYVVADLSTEQGVKKISALFAQDHYCLLINNAGAGAYGSFGDASLSELQTMIRLNCEGLISLAHACLKSSRNGDTLVNVSGLLGSLPIPRMSVYAATKSFITSFSESLWYEQSGRGVFVLGLIPGPVSTGFHEHSGGKEGQGPPARIRQIPDQVVDVGLKAIRKRKGPTAVASVRRVRFLFFLFRILPRKLVLKIMASFH